MKHHSNTDNIKMTAVTELRRGDAFEYVGNLYKVKSYNHRIPGRGHTIIRLNVQDLRTKSNLELTLSSREFVQNIRLESRTYQYLFDYDHFYVLMDTQTFQQLQLPHSVLADYGGFLRENMEVDLLSYSGEILDCKLPNTMIFEVVEVEETIMGEPATNTTKIVKTETGLRVRTPLFVEVGDLIRVSTESGGYLARL